MNPRARVAVTRAAGLAANRTKSTENSIDRNTWMVPFAWRALRNSPAIDRLRSPRSSSSHCRLRRSGTPRTRAATTPLVDLETGHDDRHRCRVGPVAAVAEHRHRERLEAAG